MRILAKCLGAIFILLAILFLFAAFVLRSSGIGNILDSPEASGRLIGSILPPIFFACARVLALAETTSRRQIADLHVEPNRPFHLYP